MRVLDRKTPIVLFLGLVVGAILISMYLPMFDLVNVVGGGG